ncbi:hypothetical protein HJC23_012918 [Cyclotella cryptica]|uniref:Uncharacterized protein n=1 Tax=Cyclotella cryptica TaxID=29204 RepID=A0ABD3Q300_9STRA
MEAAAVGITDAAAIGTGKLTGGVESHKKRQAKRKDQPKKTPSAFNSSASNRDDDGTDTTISANNIPPLSEVGRNFQPCTLPEIQARLKALMEQMPKEIPPIPTEEFEVNDEATSKNTEIRAQIKSFASQLQQTIENYNLLLSLVSSATYKWGVDRSGASQQNLSVMVSELQQCQEMISSSVSGRLSNVLCPAVDVLVGEVEIVRGDGDDGAHDEEDGNNNSRKKRKLNDCNVNNGRILTKERRINHYIRAQVDPAYVHLCHVILARNAALIRHTVATSIHTAQKVIADYLKAMKKDGGHDMAV